VYRAQNASRTNITFGRNIIYYCTLFRGWNAFHSQCERRRH